MHTVFKHLSSNLSLRVLFVSSIKKMAEMNRDFTSICKNLCLEACFSHARLIIDRMSVAILKNKLCVLFCSNN